MTQLKKVNIQGEELGELQVDDRLAQAQANGQMVKDYIVALRHNARQWSASTKGRSEVKHTTKKPHPQKGGGRSRQGSLSASQYRGGGVVFGPKPKFDQHIRINKKERRAAIRFLLAEKVRQGKVSIIDSIEMEHPKTKTVASFLKHHQLKGRTLFLTEGAYETFGGPEEEFVFKFSISSDKHHHFAKSSRNIPGVSFALARNICGYDVILANNVVMTQNALDEIVEWLC